MKKPPPLGQPRPDSVCERCGRPYFAHVGASIVAGGMVSSDRDDICPDGTGNRFRGQATSEASFSPEQIEVLSGIVETLLRGGDPRLYTRSKHFPAIAREVQRLKAERGEKT